jgi:hypothetical protein
MEVSFGIGQNICTNLPWKKSKKKVLLSATPVYYQKVLNILTFVVSFIANGQTLTTFSTTRRQYFTTISIFHTSTEAVFVLTFSITGLECAFHNKSINPLLFGGANIE